MVDIQSKEVIDKMSDELKVQPSMALPRKLVDSIQPVFEVGQTKPLIQIATRTLADATSGAIFTSSAQKDTWITALELGYVTDVLAVATSVSLRIIQRNDASDDVLTLQKTTLTVANDKTHLSLPTPILIQRGSAVSIVTDSGTGSIDMRGIVYFYETDPE